MDGSIRTSDTDGDEIGVEFHLPAQAAMEEEDGVAQAHQDAAQDPEDAVDHPGGAGEDGVGNPAPALDEPVEEVPAVDDLVDDVERGIDVGTELGAFLREMAELVGEQGLEFGEVDGVDQAEAEEQVFLGRDEQVPEGIAVAEGHRVDFVVDEDTLRIGGAGLVADAVDEVEQLGMFYPQRFRRGRFFRCRRSGKDS